MAKYGPEENTKEKKTQICVGADLSPSLSLLFLEQNKRNDPGASEPRREKPQREEAD